jgi:hypothetical protein
MGLLARRQEFGRFPQVLGQLGGVADGGEELVALQVERTRRRGQPRGRQEAAAGIEERCGDAAEVEAELLALGGHAARPGLVQFGHEGRRRGDRRLREGLQPASGVAHARIAAKQRQHDLAHGQGMQHVGSDARPEPRHLGQALAAADADDLDGAVRQAPEVAALPGPGEERVEDDLEIAPGDGVRRRLRRDRAPGAVDQPVAPGDVVADREALLAEAREEVVRRRRALADALRDLARANAVGLLRHQREHLENRSRGAQPARGARPTRASAFAPRGLR